MIAADIDELTEPQRKHLGTIEDAIRMFMVMRRCKIAKTFYNANQIITWIQWHILNGLALVNRDKNGELASFVLCWRMSTTDTPNNENLADPTGEKLWIHYIWIRPNRRGNVTRHKALRDLWEIIDACYPWAKVKAFERKPPHARLSKESAQQLGEGRWISQWPFIVKSRLRKRYQREEPEQAIEAEEQRGEESNAGERPEDT